MTTFEDGPAKGQTLMLRRAARFLRVVTAAGQWDALDQLNDSPGPLEQIFAYEITGQPGHCHINMGRGRGGFYPLAQYKFVANQPADEVMRDSKRWAEWCEKQATERKRQ